MTPRCLYSVQGGTTTPLLYTFCTASVHSGDAAAVSMVRGFLFWALIKSMPQVDTHSYAWSRSEDSSFASVCQSNPIVWAVVLSANKEHPLSSPSGKSLTKMSKSVGPETVPWGMPDFNIAQFDQWPFTSTHCFRATRNDENHFTLPVTLRY